MNIEFEEKIIKKTKDYTITIQTPVDYPFMAYAMIDTDKFCLSTDLSSIYFKVNQDACPITDLAEVSNEDIVNVMLEFLAYNESRYNTYVEEDDPSGAFVLCDKRVMARQYYKALLSGDFSDMALYDWGLELYSRLENAYGYEVLFMALETLKWKHGDKINEKLRKSLDGLIDENDEVTVYRGFNKNSRLNGTSYTTKFEIAEFFANRWSNQTGYLGVVKTYKVKVDDIIGFIDGHESEILTSKAREIK